MDFKLATEYNRLTVFQSASTVININGYTTMSRAKITNHCTTKMILKLLFQGQIVTMLV